MDEFPELLGHGIADRIGNIHGFRAGIDNRFKHAAKKGDVGAAGIFGRKFDIIGVLARPFHRFHRLFHHLLDAGRPQVIAVSSPRAGDGKTTCAINLALALAECGRAKVLLVETHVRHPQLASLFRFVPPWCFAEQLAAHRHQPLLPWGLVDIPQLWLHVAAINPRIEQSQLLDAPAFAIAMERLRLGGYDHIVIDCPPVVGSADVNLIQDAADGTLLVVRGKRTISGSNAWCNRRSPLTGDE
jgi:Mrp family chromosome partitioning ATPase